MPCKGQCFLCVARHHSNLFLFNPKFANVQSEIYNWFTEGFDTPDLKEAKALLDALA